MHNIRHPNRTSRSNRVRERNRSFLAIELLEPRAMMAVGDVRIASVTSGNIFGNDNSDKPSISSDGRYVAFNSSAANLVSGDTNGLTDIFVKDMQTGTITRANTSSSGTQANGNTSGFALSGNGRYLVFGSSATNLVAGDTNGLDDIFVKDLQTGTTTRVSTSSSGVQATGGSGFGGVSISADGRYAAFDSGAPNLVSGDTNGFPDIFVKDTQTGVTTRVNTTSAGGQSSSNWSLQPVISADGKVVVFFSESNNLVSGDTNGLRDLYAKNLQTGVVVQVNTDSFGVKGNHISDWNPRIFSVSADGRYVAFESDDSNLVPGDTNNEVDIFYKDLQTGTTTRINTSAGGTQANTFSGVPSISADGRYVAFYSGADILVPGDSSWIDVFIKDMQTGAISLVSTDVNVAPRNGNTSSPSLSADGRYIAFSSTVTNFVTGDMNGKRDIFVKQLIALPPTINFNNGVTNLSGKEDTFIFAPFDVSLGADAATGDYLTVKVPLDEMPGGAGISYIAGNVTFTPYEWTITLPPGQNLSTNFIFNAAQNYDIDITHLRMTATKFNSSGTLLSSATVDFSVTIDAVADVPTITVSNSSGSEDSSLSINMSGSLTDTDGSETITGYKISDVPAGFSFNQGTHQGNGVWFFTPSELLGLRIIPAANFDSTLNLTATVLNAETNPSGIELDVQDNSNSDSKAFIVTWRPVAEAPTINVNNGVTDFVVKEDQSVVVPIAAVHGLGASANEFLTVAISNVSPSWGTISAPVGTYDSSTGVWSITLAPGENLLTSLTFTPKSNRDADAISAAVIVSASDSSSLVQRSTGFKLIGDAVADKPSIGTTDSNGLKNAALPVTIEGSLTDTDGSEKITGYQISGVTSGFTFNHGSNLGNGIWSFTPADIQGLMINSPTGFTGTQTLTATAFNAETTFSGSEPDSTDNTNSASETFDVTWESIAKTPTILVNNGVSDVIVKEDSSVEVPLVVTHGAGAVANEILSVTISNISANWGSFSAPVGTYTPSNGRWVISLLPGESLNTTLTFTPKSNSDVDLSNLNVGAIATVPAPGDTTVTNTQISIIVDAVADLPTIIASGVSGNMNTALPLNITGALTDTDGSETVYGYEISGIPDGFTFNHGIKDILGIWTFTSDDLPGLTMTAPANFAGSLNLTATIIMNETNLGGAEIDTDDNSLTASAPFNVTWLAVLTSAVVTNASAEKNHQTTSGLVVTPGTAEATLVTHFRINNIAGGRLYKYDGVTQITNGQFITKDEGAAGLRFTPNLNSLAVGSFTVQQSTSESTSGLGGTTATATITVIPPLVPLNFSNVTAVLTNGNLVITGDSLANTVTVVGVSSGKFTITGAGATSAHPTAINGLVDQVVSITGVTGSITVNLNNGDDELEMRKFTHNGNLTINGGVGNDKITLGRYLALTANSSNVTTRITGLLTINGDIGDDTILLGRVYGYGSQTINGGDGDDTITTYVDFAGVVNFSGGPGNDNMQMGYLTANQTWTMNGNGGDDLVTAYGSRSVGNASFLGEAGNDTVALDVVVFNSNLAVNTGDGIDTLLFARCILDHDADFNTDLGDDNVLIGKRYALDSQNEAVLLNAGNSAKTVTLNTGAGNDTVQAATNSFEQFFIDMGSENDSLDTYVNLILLRYAWDGGLGINQLHQLGDSEPANGKSILNFEPLNNNPGTPVA